MARQSRATMHSNRTVGIGRFSVVVFALLLVNGCSRPDSESTESGALVLAGGETLQGEVLELETRLAVFRGIPFAAAPTGDLRWRSPAAHSPRDGVQSAMDFAPACPQRQTIREFYRSIAERFGASPDVVPPIQNISEDCLYLNIWTNNLDREEKLPVMVWIHGGGNVAGESHESEFRGHNLARRGVVYVSLSYRLGALGFLAHRGLSAESEDGVSGNYGILDLIAGLRWVRDNISAFGGDPENVTVFGESSGADSVATLIASPLASGLFHRAISQSGGLPVDTFYTLAAAERMGSDIANHLEVEDTTNPARSIEALREMSWQSIVQGAVDAEAGEYSAVNIDGWLLPRSAASIYEEGEGSDVDLLIGANRNELYPWLGEDATASNLARNLERFDSPYREELATVLAREPDVPARMSLDRLTSAESFLCPSLFIADAMAKSGNRVHFYYFTRVRPGGGNLRARHGAEIAYVHDTAYDWMPADETDRQLTETMGQYWVNFAATGSPNGDGLPQWPGFTTGAGDYQELGGTVRPGSGLETELCAIFDRRRESNM